MKIKQGDAYDIQVKLVDGDGSLISIDNNAQMVEFMIGNLRKTCPGEVEEVATKEWTGEGYFYLYISSTYLGNDAIKGELALAGKFAVGDIVDVILEDPSAVPYRTRSSSSLELIAIDSDSDPDKAILIFDGNGHFGSYTSFTQNMTIRSTEYILPLSQQDTFSLEGVVPFEARVKFADSQVVGTSLGAVMVEHSMSREVL